jgi:hypothetical protein
MNMGRRILWIAALLFCAYLVWFAVDFFRQDKCLDAGGRWIASEARCEL